MSHFAKVQKIICIGRNITDKISKIIGFQRIWGMACAVSCHSVIFMRIIFTVVCTICVIFLLAFQSWYSFFSSFWKNAFIVGFSPKRRVRQIIIQCKIIYITIQNKLYLHPFSLLLTFISPLFAMVLGVNKIFCFDKSVFDEDVCEHLRYLKDDFDNMLATP